MARSAAISSGVLQPGEVLYVPPYWMHRVFSLGNRATNQSDSKHDPQVSSARSGATRHGERVASKLESPAHNLSLAVSVFTDSAAHEAFARMQHMPLPIPADL